MNDKIRFLPNITIFSLCIFAAGIGAGLLATRIRAVPPPAPHAVPAAAVGPRFAYTFNDAGVLEEAGDMRESSSPYFWLNSGGELVISGSTGATISGSTSPENSWQAQYAADNPTDTDAGAHPQNIFRLITRSQWGNVREEAQFLVTRDNFSASPNRNASNGLLLMSRYQDSGQTLYYAGLRVDGTAVIKKKYKGTYFTMAQKEVFPGEYRGSRDEKNLLPHNEWISLRSEVSTSPNAVTVRLFMKRAEDSEWKLLLESDDHGQYDSTPPIASPGFAGIRTDFMDVRFENYRLEEL